ncbi:unnamed protein product [Parascedosporium putredinis]|uniref:MFS transporter n=2 Tax=Parascedosporium putredinis TaxID=1442378 RepID=A0A9P1H6P1_9PEZI|nr:unnamed protein product [Parascedosporium putredinis]CAI8000600.1 unnamed protein product [Parascedosporium putredinis]
MGSSEKEIPQDLQLEQQLQSQGIKTERDGEGKLHTAAGHGNLATDENGNPLVTFDPVAVRKLRWKLDLYTVPTVSFLYLFCFIDRANIGNARLAGLEKDLNLQGFDYNMILSIFYISYIIFEIPASVCCKWMGPGWFLPLTSLLFGIVSVATAFTHSRAAICGVRFLLGIFEAARRATFRLSLYMVMAPLAGAFGGLLASAILTLDNFGSLHAWRMIFAIEGIITIGLSLISFVTLTDRPETARWLTAEEKELCIARVKSERIGATEVIDGIDRKKIWSGITNPVTLEIAAIFLFNNITVQGLAFFLPTIVRSIYPEFTVVQQQLYSVPPYAVGAFFVLAYPALSWYLDRRQVLIALTSPSSHRALRRHLLIASSTMVLGPMSNAQISANVVSDTARSSAIGFNVMMGNIGGLASTWSYISWDGPDYHIGNGLNLAAASAILIIATLAWLWMKRDNKRRDGRNAEEELAGMSPAEIADLDWKHPGFRWRT